MLRVKECKMNPVEADTRQQMSGITLKEDDLPEKLGPSREDFGARLGSVMIIDAVPDLSLEVGEDIDGDDNPVGSGIVDCLREAHRRKAAGGTRFDHRYVVETTLRNHPSHQGVKNPPMVIGKVRCLLTIWV